MKIRQLKPSGTVLVAVVALVIGLEAPAMAHQVNVIAHKINGSTIATGSIPGNRLKSNGVTGKQIKESTLATVPSATNATKLGGKPAALYAFKAAASRSGLVSIPAGGATHVLFKHYPITWEGTCTVTGTTAAFTLSVKALENVWFSEGSEDGVEVVSGNTYEVDNGTSASTSQSVTDYTVSGTNHKWSSGLYVGGIHLDGDPCAFSVTAG